MGHQIPENAWKFEAVNNLGISLKCQELGCVYATRPGLLSFLQSVHFKHERHVSASHPDLVFIKSIPGFVDGPADPEMIIDQASL